jgi:DNA-binding NarL/FixJ family response regulator
VLIADDHAVVRRGLSQMIGEAFPNSCFGEAGTAHQALELATNQPWDLILLDVSMPGRNGLEVLSDLRAAKLKIPVLILSMHPEHQFAIRAMRAGADGYITKNSAPSELIKAVHKALAGEKYVSSDLAGILVSNLKQDGSQLRHENLSDREYEVLCAIASGSPVKDIASQLSLSVKTISTYRTRVLEKMDFKNNADITRYALQHRLVE